MRKKCVVSFSGGAASFVAAARATEKYGADSVDLVFCDTGIEDEDLYRFIHEASDVLGCELTILQDGRTPWDVFGDKKYQGNTRTAHCSSELKTKVFRKYLVDSELYATTIVFGFDWTETHRHDRAVKNWYGWDVWSPLTEAPYLSRDDVFNELNRYGIEVPRLYNLGFVHNNCGGFCVKAGQAHFKRLLTEMPDRYLHHEEQQEKLMLAVPNVRPFLRVTINGKLNYLTLKQFRLYVESENNIDEFDFGGCGCFL
jgi:3'-phosphoadenosine 5'-phosphosulfate sulfotransferase (PAPS reductase)/FAD synthetase